jgi:serine/threonine-protein kinase
LSGVAAPSSVPPTFAAPAAAGRKNRGWLYGGIAAAVVLVVVAVLVVALMKNGSGDDVAIGDRTEQTGWAGVSTSTIVDEPEASTIETPTAPVITSVTTVPVDPEKAATVKLVQLAAQQYPDIDSNVGYWIPQIDSKSVTVPDHGTIWTHQMILDNYRRYKTRYPDAVLIQSSSFAQFTPGFWVVAVNQPSPDETGALDWCRAEGFDRDHCYAHLITHDESVDHATAYLS